LGEARAETAELARAIGRFEPVSLLARPDDVDEATAAVSPGIAVEVVPFPLDDSWLRDTGPIWVVGPGRRLALDFRFNGWGGRFAPFDQDDGISQHWCELTGEDRLAVDLVLEGGSIAVDGDGTLVTTEQCLLHPNRNPSRTRTEIEDMLRRLLGATRVVWLPFGLDDRDTDGHVDLVAANCGPGRWLFQGCEGDDPDVDRLSISRRCLTGTLDAAGRPIEVVDIPVLPRVEVEGVALPAPYVNLYLCNGGAIVPVTGHPADADVLGLLAEVFADRAVVPVPARALAFGGGGPHCVTQQVPAPPPRTAAPDPSTRPAEQGSDS
jgi:agmatine deiminase